MSKYDATSNEQTDIEQFTNQRPTIDKDERAAAESRRHKPLVTAASVDRDNYTHVEFDEEICCILREYAKRRAPNRRSIDRHLVGIAGEIAVAAWLKVPFDTRITADYEGDRGFDLEIPRRNAPNTRVEVKTTRKKEPQANVKRGRIDNADQFFLCRTSRGADRVDIIGYAERDLVKEHGDEYGLSGYQLDPEYLRLMPDKYIGPEAVRNVHHNYHD